MVVASAALSISSCKTNGSSTGSEKPATKTAAATVTKNPGAVPVELYVMSQCPYGVQAVNAFKPAIDKLGADVDLSIEYIGDVDTSGNLTSMHGETEVKGDIAQLCAKKHAPAKYLDILECQNENMREVATNWESCTTKHGGPLDAIKKCVEGQEGKDLLTASFNKAKSKGATGSPTIYVGGKRYEDRRTADALTRAVCAAHTGPKTPATCASLPPLPVVNVKVLSDKRCEDCDSSNLERALKSRLASPKIEMIDYSDEAGRKLYEEIGGGTLPILVFDKTLDDDKEAAAQIGRGTQQKGEHRVLRVGGSWNPVCADTDGCSKAECKDTLVCRPETPNTLELFVMSQCPYGVRALDAMPEVLKNFGDKLNFRIHYIANGTAAEGFKALHGQPEVDENIRQLCVIKHYGKGNKFMDYISCRNPNIRSDDWKSCTGKNGISTEKIETCFKKEGPKLHEEDIKVGNALGIGASPTWVANGRYKFSGIDAETIRSNLCKHNKDLAGCEKTLSGPPASNNSGAAPGCGG